MTLYWMIVSFTMGALLAYLDAYWIFYRGPRK